MSDRSPADKATLDTERENLLHTVDTALQPAMLVLGFVWLILVIVQLAKGLSRTLELAATIIWIIFILDFILRFAIAPNKREFLKKNWLTTIALLAPALRIFQAFRLLRLLSAARGFSIVQILGSLNRGMNALGATLGRRGFGYVSLLTIIVSLVGAAGMYSFERNVPDPSGIHSYGTALYWTLMLVTTIGSEYWPKTPGGRTLTLLLSLVRRGDSGIHRRLARDLLHRSRRRQSAGRRRESKIPRRRARGIARTTSGNSGPSEPDDQGRSEIGRSADARHGVKPCRVRDGQRCGSG